MASHNHDLPPPNLPPPPAYSEFNPPASQLDSLPGSFPSDPPVGAPPQQPHQQHSMPHPPQPSHRSNDQARANGNKPARESTRRRANPFAAPPPAAVPAPPIRQAAPQHATYPPQNPGDSFHNRASSSSSGNPQLAYGAYHGASNGHSSSAHGEPRGQGRGSSSNVIDKGIRLAQRLNPLARGNDDYEREEDIEDVYLAVMGVTGAGKSSFIQLLTKKKVKIGHNLQSCTAFVEDFQIMYNDRIRLHLIDTPGFDDTNKSDTDVLRDIAAWLGTTYTQGIFLSGIIYLHRISDPRMSGGAMRNLGMFKELCGKDCFKSVTLATTFWGMIEQDRALANEQQLRTTPDFWGEMIELGSSYTRHSGDRESAWRIVDYMIQRRHPFLATIQREMVDGRLELNKTRAGRRLNADLIALEEKHVKEMRNLEDSYQKAKEEDDAETMRRIAELHDKLQEEIDAGKEAQADLQDTLDKINKERAEEIEQYKSDIEKRMKEMEEMREMLTRYQSGSQESEAQSERYRKQLEELQESLLTVQRRQPGIMERFDRWLDRKVDEVKAWWDAL